MRRVERANSPNLQWPHLQADQGAPLRANLAKHLFLRSVSGLPLSVRTPDGICFGAGKGQFADGGDPSLRINDEKVFFARIGRDGALGFGESFLLGAWDSGESPSHSGAASDELVTWLTVYSRFLRTKESQVLYRLRELWHLALPVSERNSEQGALSNVRAHYDLDPRLFRLFLDDSMTYSSAWFEADDDLETAQLRKIDAILDLAKVDRGKRVLDIGSGFGGLAIRAAGVRGADVVGLTLSEKQLEYALSRSKEAGLGARISCLLEDYRRHSGAYDSIVSVEMMEAVGRDYWVDYFQTVDRLLKPEGAFGLQVITFPHRRMLASRNDFSWVDRYIFPGGALPSLREIYRIVESATSLEITEARRLNDSYARTLREWRHRFVYSIPAVKQLGFDDIFLRLWILYFAYFEAGFRSRYCDVWQLGMRKYPPRGELSRANEAAARKGPFVAEEAACGVPETGSPPTRAAVPGASADLAGPRKQSGDQLLAGTGR